jgi:putative zinc finger/helix-turn-helix YgiT family protein
MVKRCVQCGARGLSEATRKTDIDVGQRTFTGEVRSWKCRSCGEIYFDGPDLAHLEELVARWLVDHGFETGKELRFLRKHIALKASDLASLLGVTPETVSHWETGKSRLDVGTRAAVAALVVDKLAGSTGTRDRLAALRKPAKARRVKLARQQRASA